jgi:ATP-dependent Clp protease ATP-binding subunit ClpC
MEDLRLDYKSARSEKARIGVKIDKAIVIFLQILTLSLVFGGFALIFWKNPIGWAIVGISAIPVMIVEWYNGELKSLKVVGKPRTIDDVLSGDILGRLDRRPTPQEVAVIVNQVPGGQFMAARFGIGAGFLQNLTSNNDADMQTVWQEAWRLRVQTGSEKINSVILTAALIKNAPNYQSLLSHLQLDDSDLVRGIEWYDHLVKLIEKHSVPKRTGGVARDWSFGWTPLLNRFGQNISLQMSGGETLLTKLESHDDLLNQLIEIFSKNGRQNAVLVGQPGVGKTQIVRALASRLMDASASVPSGLKFRQIFILDASSIIAAASGRGELERLVPQVLIEAYRAKNIIICLDNAQLFFEDNIGSIDISNVLLPILEAGNLRMILTMDEQEYLKICNRIPQIANSINRLSVAPATRDQTIAVMQEQSIVTEFRNGVTYMYQSLSEAYRLSDRYVHDLAMPGKALKLFESAANYSENGLVTARSVQQAIEKTLNVKIGVASSDNEREKLLNLESLIHERMINQSRAVSVVSDALRRARAGVRNQNRPIGAFLFLGPTGVGKTELAKALAAIYFDGEDHIIRVDMNEYSRSDDVARLIADGANNLNSLTARVMKQPFSVILLDEIEKAHPNVLLTLLQMLDEGVLRDEKNREISFRDAIIIATSNAGADKIREHIERGYDIERFEDQIVNGLIDSGQFRPEFLNRFDEIVMFRPLNKNELVQVVNLMINDVNKTLSQQKISVEVADDAKNYLAEVGYDPRLGARPMRRIVQKTVENMVAKQVLSGEIESGSIVKISLEQVKNVVSLRDSAQQIIESQK